MSSVRTTAQHGIKGVKMRDAGNVLRTIGLARLRDASNLVRTVFSALTASRSMATVMGTVNSGAARSVQTQSVTASPDGGVAPYTYAWARTAPDGNAWTINSPTSATTTFTAQAVGPDDSFEATFVCTITDANGSTATTPDVQAIANNVFFEFGGPLP